MTGSQNHIERPLYGGFGVHRDDVDARNHDFTGDPIAKLEDGIDHFLLFVFDHAFFGTRVHQRFDLFLGYVRRFFSPAKNGRNANTDPVNGSCDGGENVQQQRHRADGEDR